MKQDLSSADWRRLIRSIKQGSCVLFLGPDAAFMEGEGESLVSSLAREFVNEFEKEHASDLHLAAQSFAQDGHDEFDLIDVVESFYKPFKSTTTKFHCDLAALPFQLCVQTTPDRLMYNAFAKNAIKSPSEAYFHLRSGSRYYNEGVLSSNPSEPSSTKPLVFGLNGSAEDGFSVVLTENDVLEFLTRLVRDKATLPGLLLRRIKLATTCLFIGFGFHQWYQRLILHALRDAGTSPKWRSLALESNRFFAHPEQLQTATYYDREHRIDFSHLSFLEFASELRERFELEDSSLASIGSIPVRNTPNAPKAFLSYSSGDTLTAEALGRELSCRGINIWQDINDIRGGEDWEHKIKHVLREVVDYVVVLHSEKLKDEESWVQYEINIALERNKKMPPNFSFIIPCHFLGCKKRRSSLQNLQYIEVSAPDEGEKLIKTILKDWRENRQVEYAHD